MSSFTIVCNSCKSEVELKDEMRNDQQTIRLYADAYGDMCSGIEFSSFRIQCNQCWSVIELDN